MSRLPEAEATQPRVPPPRRAPLPELTAFSYRAYRFWWVSSATVLLNQFMTMVTMAWLILQLTDSAAWVSVTVFAFGLPSFLFTVPAGALADRWDRRKQLMTSQSAALVNALAMAGLVSLDLMTPELALLFAAITGSTVAFSQPARQSIIPQLVAPEHRMNAIVLGSLSQNLSQLVGPALAGVLIATIAISAAFFALAALLVVGIVCLYFMRLETSPTAANTRRFHPGELLGGFAFLWRTRSLLVVAGLYAATGFWIGGAIQTLVPVLVRDHYHAGASALGFAYSVQAIAAITTSLWITRLGGVPNKGGLFAASMALAGSAVAGYGLAPTYPIALVGFFIFGCAAAFYANMSQTLLQVHSPPEVLGRVLAIITLSVQGFIPLGALQAGFVASAAGPRAAAVISGSVAVALALLALSLAKGFRRLE